MPELLVLLTPVIAVVLVIGLFFSRKRDKNRTWPSKKKKEGVPNRLPRCGLPCSYCEGPHKNACERGSEHTGAHMCALHSHYDLAE